MMMTMIYLMMKMIMMLNTKLNLKNHLKKEVRKARKVRKVNKKAKVIATAQSTDDAMALYKAGADYVTLPHFLGGEHIANLITGVRKKAINLNQRKEDHLKELKLRQKHGHDHPSYFY